MTNFYPLSQISKFSLTNTAFNYRTVMSMDVGLNVPRKKMCDVLGGCVLILPDLRDKRTHTLVRSCNGTCNH